MLTGPPPKFHGTRDNLPLGAGTASNYDRQQHKASPARRQMRAFTPSADGAKTYGLAACLPSRGRDC